jgi:hypothetical protein
MAKLHTVTTTTKEPDLKKALRGFFEVRNAIKAFVAKLRTAADNLDTDKSASATAAVSATMDFLRAIHAPIRLSAPLAEALNIIGIDYPKAMPKERQGMVMNSIAVELQRRCGVKLEDALKKVAGRDPQAVNRLKNFKYNMLEKDSPRGAQELYFSLLQGFKGMSPKSAADLALTVSKAWRGKKS